MSAYEWAASETGPKNLTLILDGEEVGYVEQEMERHRHDPSTDTPTGRWEWSAGGHRGVASRRSLAMRRAQREVGLG